MFALELFELHRLVTNFTTSIRVCNLHHQQAIVKLVEPAAPCSLCLSIGTEMEFDMGFQQKVNDTVAERILTTF